MKITRRFTKSGQDPFSTVEYARRTSRITNPDGSVVFEMTDAEVPSQWSQLATDIMVSKYFRKAGVPQLDAAGQEIRDEHGNVRMGPERSARQVIHRLAGCWRHWGETHGYFDTPDDAQAFYDELAYMLLHQMCAPNSPQWFNTGLNFAYGITGPSQGHFYCDPKTGQLLRSDDAYTHPQPHACQPYHAPISTPQGPIAIGEIVTQKLTGLEVYDGRDGGKGTTRVVAVKSNGEKPVFRIVLKNGTFVEATADHQIWAIDERRTQGQWLRVDELSAGQRLQLSTVTSVTKASDERTVRECALAGWLQGDGFVGQYAEGTNQSLTLEFMTVDADEHAYVMGLIGQVFEGVDFNVRTVDAANPELTLRRIRLYGEALRPFVEKYDLLRNGSEHAVPAAVARAGQAAQCAYLQALFQADGTVRRRVRDSRTADIVLTSVSETLAHGVQALLLNLGIYARIQRGVEKRDNRRTPWFVSIGYAASRARYRDLIGFISATKQQKLADACADAFTGKEVPPLREETIVRIELVGTQAVYDIQTESGQYLSNNVIVHNCFIQSVSDDLVNAGGIMDLWTREARLFKYGSGTGSNFSKLRGENEKLSGGGKSSGLMSFLKIGDRAAGAIKSGGTTRRAAKMVCLDLDHPDIEDFVNWKVREELKVAAMAEGLKHLPPEQRQVAERLGLKLNYDFNGEAYHTVSGQNSNNSVRIPNRFFKALQDDGDWVLTYRTSGKVAHKLKARKLWEEISFAAWRCADPGVQYDDTINQWHTCPRSGRINASNPCVTGDTRVLTPGGIWRRIDQMIHLPARIVTNLHEQEIHATDGAFPTGVKEVYELRTQGGYRLKVTADHQFWTRRRGWVEARHLTPDDELRLPALPATVQEIGEPRDARLFQLLGLLLSETNADTSAIHLEACLEDSDLSEQFTRYITENWSQRPYTDDYLDQMMVDISDITNTDGATLTVSVSNRRLISRLRAYVCTVEGQRRLGDEAFTAGLAAQKHLLAALFTADGRFNNGSLELPSSSHGLLEDVQLLLLGFGIQSTIFSYGDGGASATESASLRRGGSQSHRILSDVSRSGPPQECGDASQPRHGLRIDLGGLRSFVQHVSLLSRRMLEQLEQCAQDAAPLHGDSRSAPANHDRFASLTPLGRRQVFDLTEPATSSFIANGLTVHNCSEYMFLDDTACNLASLNVLTFFDAESRRFDIDAFRHAIRIWTMVLEISVLMASFPSEQIARLSYRYRTLGLGYANLGAMLMQAGIPYDSDKGRAVCAALTAILTGESYAASAEMAEQLGAFDGYADNRADMLRVMRNHRRAAYDVARNAPARQAMGEYEQLDILPVGIDLSQFTGNDPLVNKQLLRAAQECWDRALMLGEKHGYRNAQATVIAPTGTIGLLMDCDTTGVEPDFALVKFKKLAGGGYFKIANQSLAPALKNLGYAQDEIHDILKYVMGTLTLHDAPHISYERLKLAGFTEAELDRVEAALPGVFELGFAFTPWSIGEEAMKRLGVDEQTWKKPDFNLLKWLGFNHKQITEANDVVCGRGSIEGAPHLKESHLAVFDTANKCGKYGTRFIAAQGHIRMMAAAQPFISGAISKTINLPHEATVADVAEAYDLSWKLGLKANALYRDGSKLSQPLNVKSDADLDKVEEDDEQNVAAAREELVRDASAAIAKTLKSDNLAPAHTKVIEKIVERIVERPLRRRLPDTRHAMTHKFDIGGHEGYITVGLYEDGQPGEVFITMAKEGSTIGGLMDTIATLVSVSLQYGVPVDSLVRKFEHVRFEPSGMTRNPEIPIAKSLVDYIFRWLAMEFIPGYRAAHAPKRPTKQAPVAAPAAPATAEAPKPTAAPKPAEKKGNGHSRLEPDAKPFDYGSGLEQQVSAVEDTAPYDNESGAGAEPNLRLTLVSDPLSQQGADMQSDAPACDVCGSITVRSGTCYKCLNCGNSMGCS